MKNGHKIIITILAVAMALFHIYTSAFGMYTALIQRGMHLMFVLALIFLIFPVKKGVSRKNIPLYDYILSLLGFVVGAYIVINYNAIVLREGQATQLDIIMGVVAIILVLEATRRTLGLPLVIIGVIFLIYAFAGPHMPGALIHRGYDIQRVAYQMYMTTSGIFGIPFGVSATTIAMFIIFASFINKTGGGKYFVDLAFSIAGRTRGGPAKAAVIGSCIMGSITGAAVANVAATGTFTIPLMKRTGYKPHIAGAIEAVASTGSQIMPPIMGSAAFIMAEMAEIPYSSIMVAALIPALFYYFSLFLAVDIEAAKHGLKGLTKKELPPLKKKKV